MGLTQFVSETDKFTLDGVSSDTKNLFVDYMSPMPLAEQKYTDFNVGEDEYRTTPDDVFGYITYVIHFYTFLPDNYNDSEVKAFCFNKKTLTLSRYPNYYFKIRQIRLMADDGLGYAKRIDYTLTLTLAPFKYAVDNAQITLTNGETINNTHTRYSKPTFEITGTGDITLTVNGENFYLKGLSTSQTVIVDSTRHITYSGNTLLTGKTDGKYPLLNIGGNTVSWTGNVSSVKYNGNWRDL